MERQTKRNEVMDHTFSHSFFLVFWLSNTIWWAKENNNNVTEQTHTHTHTHTKKRMNEVHCWVQVQWSLCVNSIAGPSQFVFHNPSMCSSFGLFYVFLSTNHLFPFTPNDIYPIFWNRFKWWLHIPPLYNCEKKWNQTKKQNELKT